MVTTLSIWFQFTGNRCRFDNMGRHDKLMSISNGGTMPKLTTQELMLLTHDEEPVSEIIPDFDPIFLKTGEFRDPE